MTAVKIFRRLQQTDPKVLEERERAVNERIHTTFLKSQQRLADLVRALHSKGNGKLLLRVCRLTKTQHSQLQFHRLLFLMHQTHDGASLPGYFGPC